MRDSTKAKRRDKRRRGVLFHQDNAPVNIWQIATRSVWDCDFELLPLSPYYPDLFLSDYSIFLNCKRSSGARDVIVTMW